MSHNPVDRVLILLDAFDIALAHENYPRNTKTTNERAFDSIICLNTVFWIQNERLSNLDLANWRMTRLQSFYYKQRNLRKTCPSVRDNTISLLYHLHVSLSFTFKIMIEGRSIDIQ